GARAWFSALLLLVWVVLTGALAWAYHRRRRRWTEARINVTQELVERMVGHRTRLIQQAGERQHDGEDETLSRYVEQSKGLDWLNVTGLALVPRGWLIAGMAAVAPGVVSG